jgi:hypothetical protein
MLLITILTPVSCIQAQQFRSSEGSKQPQIVHVSFSRLDQWTQCVRELTGKPLLLAQFNPSADLSCPSGLDEVNRQIEGNGSLVPGDGWDLLIGKGITPSATPADFWKDVTVSLSAKAWEPQKGSRQPSAAELEQLSSAALRAVRPSLGVVPPVAAQADAGHATGANAKIKLEFLFDIHRLSPDGPESIIGVLREAMGGVRDGRVIYGEFRSGKPVFLWDSPRLTTRLLNLNYRDLDHDGVEEILLMGFPASRGTIGELVIFTHSGEELSRQPGDSEGFAAPIVTGGTVKFVPDGHGGPDLLEIPDESDESKVEAYVLNQTYEKRSDKSSTTLNEQGLQLMKSKSYEAAAVKFTEAFRLNPSEALFANNAGFALYRAGKLQDAVLWFRQALALDPRRAVAYLNLGDALVKLNQTSGAREAYKKYLDLAPDSKPAPDVRKKLEALQSSP